MSNLLPPELTIILLIAVLLFGVGRLGRLGGELGEGIRELRRGTRDDDSYEYETGESSEAAED